MTATRIDELVVVLLPSCPKRLSPQQRTWPPVTMAQVWRTPAAIWVAPESPVTATVVDELVVVPLPS